ncbi:putative nucleotidyltransferase, ribonuclease H [Tanacetum coccineum]
MGPRPTTVTEVRWFSDNSDASKEGSGGIVGEYEVESNLMLQIKEDQRDDGGVWAIVQNVKTVNILSHSREGYDGKLIVLHLLFIKGSTKMYKDLEPVLFGGSGMKQDVATLPTTQKRHDAIWVVVDRLTKSAHFLPVRKDYGISKLAEIFRQEIVRLHGTPTSIVSDRDPKFTSRFWKGLQKAWGTRLKFSTAFHPQTDGQSERTIQTLEDMLRACALEWTGSWDEYLCLVEFAYNNSWHASIKAAPFELLYGRKCRAPICWDEVGERLIEGPELIEITNEKVAVAKEKLKEARSRQKSYADKHRRDLEFQVGDRVFLKVSPFRGVKRFGIKGKLSPRFIGPFEILERIGEVSYRLALPPQLSHVHDVFHVSLLRGYHYHPLHVASYPFDQIQPDMSLSEEPESILDRQERVMRNKVIPFVKILWKNHPEREATWETEESMRASLRRSRKLKPEALNLYVGNGYHAAVEAIGSFHLCLPSGLVSYEDLEIIQEEDEPKSSINPSLHHDEDDQEIDEPKSSINPIRRDHNEPANYKAAFLDPDKWLDAMNVEIQSVGIKRLQNDS